MAESLDLSTVLWTHAELGDWRFRHQDVGRQRLVALPNSNDTRHLLPWGPATVLATARRVSDDRPRRRQWRDAIGVAGALTAGVVGKTRRLGIEYQGSLVETVASQLGHTGARGIVLCGPARANQKPVVQLYDRGGRTIAYVKVAWNDLTRRLLEDERSTLIHLSAITDKGFSTPPVLAHGTFGPATWLALGPIGVERRSRPDLVQVDALAIEIERTGTSQEGRSIESDYVARLTMLASDLEVGAEVVAGLTDLWSDCTMKLGASHGDFVPWNMTSGSPEPAVWDWERYQMAAPLGFDRLHYRTQIGLHRKEVPLAEALRRIGSELEIILPELPDEQRRSHFDWYIADVLCRYERDAGADPVRLTSFVTDLAHILKERNPLT